MASSEELEFPIGIDLDGERFKRSAGTFATTCQNPKANHGPASASFLSQSLRSACFNTSCAEASEAKSNWPATHGALAQPFQVFEHRIQYGNVC